MSRTFFVGGNWKMNGSQKLVENLLSGLNNLTNLKKTEVVIAPPSLYIPAALALSKGDVQIAGQNAYEKASGAFTGEISAEMLKDIGVGWVILGHSERRTIFGESDDLIARKTKHCLSAGLKVIFCIGETLQEREQDLTLSVVSRQLEALRKEINDWSGIVIAYEPVWAIGTGRVASPEQAQQVHEEIRKWLAQNVGKNEAQTVRIIYGGSVTGDNCQLLAQKEDIDGFLVGGASLKPEFLKIAQIAE